MNATATEVSVVTVMVTEFGFDEDSSTKSSASHIIKRLNDVLLQKNRGIMIKDYKNRTVYSFEDCGSALGTAHKILELMDKYNNLKINSKSVTTRIVLHSGLGTLYADVESSGLSVVAMVILSSIKATGIYLTEETYGMIDVEDRELCRLESSMDIKGLGQVKVYKVSPEKQEVVQALPEKQETPQPVSEKQETAPPVPEKQENAQVLPEKQEIAQAVSEKQEIIQKVPSTPIDQTYYVQAPEPEVKSRSTIDTLQGKFTSSGGFPIMSKTVDILMKLPVNVLQDDTHIANVTNSILTDYGLTSKILALVNTSYYSQYGGKVGTISRALMLLGFIQVRNAALSLILFEGIVDKSMASELKQLIVGSLMKANIAKSLAGKIITADPEEAFICAMLHDLGKIMVAYFLPEEHVAITEKMKSEDLSENSASTAVLGTSYEDLSVSIAKGWSLPEHIIHSMKHVDKANLFKPITSIDKSHMLVSYSTDLGSVILDQALTNTQKRNSISDLTAHYSVCFNITEQQIRGLYDNLLKEINVFLKVYESKAKKEPIIEKINSFLKAAKASEFVVGEKTERVDSIEIVETEILGLSKAEAKLNADGESLNKGLSDIVGALTGEYTVNDVLRIILEIMYRTMGFSRVFICIRNPKTNTMEARFGFGSEVEKVIRIFKFSLNNSEDVFNSSLTNNTDMLVADSTLKDARSRIPDWYLNTINAHSFTALPIVLNDKPIGMIYGDVIYGGNASLKADMIWNLKIMRKLALLAFKQKLQG
ncbi:MAG: HDOD domain-containing protein [Nitrospirae bacterium]|nr:HDOD domain-containing protein [Nitrospirota bacterium]MBF0534663.1 HDOD domain-containing protein [Nitrospirota bacterium]MBF0616293.1 HDOD domain-containing protein [Nitrospirota bacterium]